jgi:hypothetical protein
MPGILLVTNVIKPLTPINVSAPQRSKWVAALLHVQLHCGPQATRTCIPTGAQQQIVTQHAMSILTTQEQASSFIQHDSHTTRVNEACQIPNEF